MTALIGETDEVYRERATALANMLTLRPERHEQETFVSPKLENECGTVACVAGWSALAYAGVVTIALNGEMTWTEDGMHTLSWWDTERHESVPMQTLYDGGIAGAAERTGRKWLGLSREAAGALFYTMTEQVAVEVLRGLGDGRLDRRRMDGLDIANIYAELRIPS